ncbi:MAG: GIY-YIG nuclease family protein [Candidatus Omnitrophota bacterium]|nr:GIY-YIG nuclease family protein [Candidatus Omnitrophota bacterium]
MYNVYALLSLKNGKRYIGFTSKTPELRLKEHNKGCNSWARQNRPFELIYMEECDTSKEARNREKFLKSGQGRREIDNVLRARSSTG